MPYETSAGAIVFRKENGRRLYLLLHYSSGHWDFVKGHTEQGEEEKTTVLREAKEETRITDLTIIDEFRERIEYFYKRSGRTMHKEVFFYIAETRTKKVSLSHEHIGYEWMDYSSASARLTFENARGILRKADQYLSTLLSGGRNEYEA